MPRHSSIRWIFSVCLFLVLGMSLAACWATDQPPKERPSPVVSDPVATRSRINAAFKLFNADVLPGAVASGEAFPAFNLWREKMQSAVRAGMKVEALSAFPGPGGQSTSSELRQACKDADSELAPFKPPYPETTDVSLLAALQEGWTACGLTRGLLLRTQELTSADRNVAADQIGAAVALKSS